MEMDARDSVNNYTVINGNTTDSKMNDDIIDTEMNILSMDDNFSKEFNLYRYKKLISHGLMDVALLTVNANQLRYVFESANRNAIHVVCIMLLLTSIVLQILVGLALILSVRYNVTNSEQRKMAFKLGNLIIVGMFLITVVNIFITAFGGSAVTPH